MCSKWLKKLIIFFWFLEIQLTFTYVLQPFRSNCQMQTLLIDNYDSYTYNIWQLVAEINQKEPIVIHNDAFRSWEELQENLPHFDNIILSPGPGRPEISKDFGLCKDAILRAQVPILGVCLGHQGLGWLNGGKVSRAPLPMHGRKSRIYHTGTGIFEGIPNGFEAVRYHSLLVDHLPPGPLRTTAWTSDNLLMGIEHAEKPFYGVQFHPESISTEYGRKIFENFFKLTIDYLAREREVRTTVSHSTPIADVGNFKFLRQESSSESSCITQSVQKKKYVFVETVDVSDFPVTINMTELFSSLYPNENTLVWLDSETSGPTDLQKRLYRTSYFAAIDTPTSFALEYSNFTEGTILHYHNDSYILKQHILEYIQEQLELEGSYSVEYLNPDGKQLASNLSFIEGYLGYFGYELGKEISHILSIQNGYRSSVGHKDFQILKNYHQIHFPTSYPLAFLLHPSRYIAYQHQEKRFYIVSHGKSSTAKKPGSESRLTLTEGEELKSRLLAALALLQGNPVVGAGSGNTQFSQHHSNNRSTLFAKKTTDQYEKDIAKCLHYITEGESYEICLTVQFHGICNRFDSPLSVYNKLREFNPAPYSAYLKHESSSHSHHNRSSSSFAICCTSPEQYLKLTKDKTISSKPIKGTIKRNLFNPEIDQQLANQLRQDEKSQAENLMIVDLVRNDLGRICSIGTVKVPVLMNVESYATVHQLVSTIEGQLSPNYTIVDALVHTFPGGSMTGAPKLRTMEIIEEIEQQPRGIYSGTMGFIGSNGIADLNIIIRTAVVQDNRITIGAGGAIVAQSDPKEEVEEVLLKAKAVGNALGYNVEFLPSSLCPENNSLP